MELMISKKMEIHKTGLFACFADKYCRRNEFFKLVTHFNVMIHTIVILFYVFLSVTLIAQQVEASDTFSISGIFVFFSLLASKGPPWKSNSSSILSSKY